MLAARHDDDDDKEDLALNNEQWLICHKTNQPRLNDGMQRL